MRLPSPLTNDEFLVLGPVCLALDLHIGLHVVQIVPGFQRVLDYKYEMRQTDDSRVFIGTLLCSALGHAVWVGLWAGMRVTPLQERRHVHDRTRNGI